MWSVGLMLFEAMSGESFYNVVIANHPNKKATIDKQYIALTQADVDRAIDPLYKEEYGDLDRATTGMDIQGNADNNKKVVMAGIQLLKLLLKFKPQQRPTPEEFVQEYLKFYTLTRHGSLRCF